ncbi:hypothetical protein B0A49_09919 [Cryomyces minteri]|uniref:Uncharacterized protein n=1 Tax=Cryomyces minteri TaxID=331657 RepID=A0A4U0WKP7_9PEZI|nr:hypothetical protein B0A49_09919 [Cryomyces minteri]
MKESLGNSFPDPAPNSNRMLNLCQYMENFWSKVPAAQQPVINGRQQNPIDALASVFPGSDNQWNAELVLLESGINAAKAGMWGRNAINDDSTMAEYLGNEPDRAIKNIKNVLTALVYHRDGQISQILVNQARRVEQMMGDLDTIYLPAMNRQTRGANYAHWKPVGLQQYWRQWMRGRADIARVKATTYIEKYMRALQDGYNSPSIQEFIRQHPNDPASQTGTVLINKINHLQQTVDNAPAWTNPF